MSSGSLRLPGVTALAAAALWVNHDKQHVIGPVSVRKYVQNVRHKLSESRLGRSRHENI